MNTDKINYAYNKYFCIFYLLYSLWALQHKYIEFSLTFLFIYFELYFIFNFKKMSVSSRPFIYILYLIFQIPQEYQLYISPLTIIIIFLTFGSYYLSFNIYKHLDSLNIKFNDKSFLYYSIYSKNIKIIGEKFSYLNNINNKIKHLIHNKEIIPAHRIYEYASTYNKKIEELESADFELIKIIGY